MSVLSVLLALQFENGERKNNAAIKKVAEKKTENNNQN